MNSLWHCCTYFDMNRLIVTQICKLVAFLNYSWRTQNVKKLNDLCHLMRCGSDAQISWTNFLTTKQKLLSSHFSYATAVMKCAQFCFQLQVFEFWVLSNLVFIQGKFLSNTSFTVQHSPWTFWQKANARLTFIVNFIYQPAASSQ